MTERAGERIPQADRKTVLVMSADRPSVEGLRAKCFLFRGVMDSTETEAEASVASVRRDK